MTCVTSPPPPAAASPAAGPSWRLVALIAVVAMSLSLRPVATTIGPVLEEVSADLGLSATVSGVLTALPGLVFGLVAGVAVTLGRKMGPTAALVTGLAVLVAGLLLRTIVSSVPLLMLFSVVALAGAAVGNVLVPAFVKRHFPGREAGVMSAYAAALGVGAMAGALVSAPIAARSDHGWRLALGLWAGIAAIALFPWLVILIHERRRHGGSPPKPVRTQGQVWRSRQAIALAAFFGVQSMQAYVQFGWVPQMFRDAGLPATTAGSLGALIAGFGLPSGLLMPMVVARVRDLRPTMLLLGATLSAGYLGILLAPTTTPWLWAALLGISSAAFPTALALMTARTRVPGVTAKVSGFTQMCGYLLAAAGPFAIGALLRVTGGWTVPLVLLILCGPVLVVTGVLAGRHHVIDDDLAASA